MAEPFEPLTKQDRAAILFNMRNPVFGIQVIMPLALERYEATIIKLETELLEAMKGRDV